MQRYTNWGLVTLGAIFVAVWLVSPQWIPEVQPLVLDDEEAIVFNCASYITEAECDVLQDIFAEDPDQAEAQQAAMDPENDQSVINPNDNQLAETLRSQLNISDQPDVINVLQGVFRPPADAIHNARGRVRIFRIATIDGASDSLYLRLDSGADGEFTVTNGPNLNLVLYLSPDPSPEAGDDFGDAYRVEGRLSGNSGQLNFDLPNDLDVLRFRTLIIYNPDYDQIFGIAEFIEPISN